MESPFKGHLHTNYVPSIFEVHHIQQLLRTIYNEELSSIDAEIHQLQQQLNILFSKRDMLAKDIDAHKALTSPIRRLPPEVLQEIFMACLPDDRNPCMAASEAPMLLTRICNSWYKVAVSTPGLWARIHIVLPTASSNGIDLSEKIQQRQVVVNEWLARSRSCPLSISVYQAFSFSRTYRSSTTEKLHILFFQNTLIAHAQRWYDINLYMTPRFFSVVQRIPASDLPMLKKFHISSLSILYGGLPAGLWKNALILQSPCLEALTLSLKFQPLQMPEMALLKRWPRLISLSLRIRAGETSTGSPSIISMISQSCPLLENLRLYIDIPSSFRLSPSFDEVIKVSLPNLKALAIATSGGHAGHYSPLFGVIDAPSLQHFELYYYPQLFVSTPETIYTALSALLTNFGTNLLSWKLYPIGLDTEYMTSLLKLTPCLRELTFSSGQFDLVQWHRQGITFTSYEFFDDTFMQLLTPSLDEDPENIVCPQLEIFKCTMGIATKISEEAVANFIRARRHLSLRGLGNSMRHIEITVLPGHAFNDNICIGPPPYSEEGVSGGLVYLREPARGSFSPHAGCPFSLAEISREMGRTNTVQD
ncbi:hypothetical protein BDQ17DRAFT_1356254 [Cyathus striatus]|nr:hypothetical protein BDQ17DRAFT_1356254 [Cyathus striatus]